MYQSEITLRAKAVIEELTLTHSPKVYARKRPRTDGRARGDNKLRQGITVVSLGRKNLGHTNERETWGYQLGIFCKYGDGSDNIKTSWPLDNWVGNILQRFQSGRLCELTPCELHMTVSQADVPEDMFQLDNDDVSYIRVTVMVREPRIAAT